MSIKIHRLPLAVMVTALLSTACIKEKAEVCYSGLLLHYHYDLNPDGVNRFDDEVHKLTILAFDSNDRFYEAFEVSDHEALVEENLISLPLPDGQWTIVTWGGDLSTYDLGVLNGSTRDFDPFDYMSGATRGQATLADHRLGLNNFIIEEDGSELVTSNLSDLFYGEVKASTVTSVREVPHTEVFLIRNTNTLSVQLNGLPADDTPGKNQTRAHVDNVTVHADMVNGRCRADNEICLDAHNVHYEQTHAISSTATELDVDLTVMRLFSGDEESMITVSGTFLEHHGYPSGEIQIPVVPTIMASPEYNTQEDLDRENYYEFLLDFDADMNLSIWVNGWKVVNVYTPGL
jgi:hypothetical protein